MSYIGLKCQIVMYVSMTYNLVASIMIFSELLLYNVRTYLRVKSTYPTQTTTQLTMSFSFDKHIYV
jgi:hypothetical protein